jgi:uncharacterized membrane protein YeaQ/YmgE (transglycosylase-associated protein family)
MVRQISAATLALPLIAAKGKISFSDILIYVVVGAIVGLIARLIVPRTQGLGFGITIVLGIIGAVLGGWLAGTVFEETTGVDWLASILVAAILVWIATRAGRRSSVA